MSKSAKRCAIATLPNQHESGTFCPSEGIKALSAAEIAADGGR
jgi:hypothetical protein